MSQTTETNAGGLEQKATPQNLPSDMSAAPGRAITAAVPQQVDRSAAADSAAAESQADSASAPGRTAAEPQAVRLAAGAEPQAAYLTAAAEPRTAHPIAAPESRLTHTLAADSPAPAITAATPDQAAALGLTILAEARWPESAHDHTPPNLAGFIVSTFSPIAAETAARCLGRCPATAATDAQVTAILIVTSRGDRQSAAHVARTVAANGVLGPLLFFQAVPNAVAGHIAARWNLTGPVICLADPASALETAALLIEDGDADQALVIRVEQGDRDQAHAVLLQPPPGARP